MMINSYCNINLFAAFAALRLVEEGKLELGVLIDQEWPEVAGV